MKKIGEFIGKNKKIIITIILLLVVVIGGSYAWLSLNITGTKTNKIVAGRLQLTLDNNTSTGITLAKAVPMSDEKGLKTEAYTFTLNNTGTINSDYTIYLDDEDLSENETRMLDKYVKYSLVKNNVTTTNILTSVGENPMRVLDTDIIGEGDTNTYSLRVWIDSGADNAVMNTVFKTKLRVSATQSQEKTICKRATTLHTETCSQTDGTMYCSGAGYTASGSKGTTTITYGNLGTTGSLTSGDAFDCDVNNDGTYDSDTERFYYVSGKDGDNTSDYATLIYYNNVASGVASNTTSFAYNTTTGYLGPQTAMLQLPTTTQWKTTLSNTTRNILDQTGTVKVSNYDYSGYAARLLTVQEVNSACNITVGNYTRGELDSCNYLIENTMYSNSSVKPGYWLESAHSGDSNGAWLVGGSISLAGYVHVDNTSNYGVRPAIEVLKSNILN